MKTLIHFAVSAALAGVLVGAKLIAQTSARVADKSSVAEPMEIPLWPGVAPGSEGWTGTNRSIRPLAGGQDRVGQRRIVIFLVEQQC